jgi:hypothetical protein
VRVDDQKIVIDTNSLGTVRYTRIPNGDTVLDGPTCTMATNGHVLPQQ